MPGRAGVHDLDLGAGRLEQLGGLGVGKGERRATGHGNDRSGAALEPVGRPGRVHEIPRGAGDLEQAIEVERVAAQLTQATDAGQGFGRALGDRDQAEMAAGRGDLGIASQHAEHRGHAGKGCAQQLLVAVARDPVEDHPREAQILVVGSEPVDERGNRPAHRGTVDHEYDGGVQQLGDVRGRPELGRAFPVVQAHDALDDGDVGAG